MPKGHYKLIDYLKKSGCRAAALVGGALKDLRLERNRADYEMKAAINADASAFVYLKASKAMADFDAISPPEMEKAVERIQKLP